VPEAFKISNEHKERYASFDVQDALPQICEIASAGFEGLASIAISDVQSWAFHSAEKHRDSKSNEHPTRNLIYPGQRPNL
jgi:hypothetical protein